MDRLLAMTTLLAAVEHGSLSAASRQLRVPLSTVSRRVSELEAHLGTALVTRTSRRLQLTDAGDAYVLAARRILEEIEDAELAASGEYSAPRGHLAITAPIVFGRWRVLPIVTEFLAAYPEIDVGLTLADRMVDLVDAHVDVALRIGALADSSLHAVRVGEVRQVAAASADYLARNGVPKAPHELSRHSCVTFGPVAAASHSWTFRGAGKAIVAPIRSRLAVDGAEAAVDAAIASVGIARVLSYQVEPAIRSGALVPVLQEFEPPPTPVSLVYPDLSRMPLKTRAFLDFAVPRLRAAL